MNIRIFISASALIWSVACGSGTPVTQSCASDAECGEFKCLHDKRFDSASSMCVNVPLPSNGTCSPECRTHADCTKYGATFKCALSQSDVSCNPTGICLDDYHITCTPGPCREAPAS